MNSTELPAFERGAAWVRADFHLHTSSDKEFIFEGTDNDFIAEYIQGLKNAGITIGAVTNHNKFAADKFRNLRKAAKKEGICLLPGVELSVNDGANGVHTLVIFSDEWLAKGNDYISPFIGNMFPGKAENEYQNGNGRSDKNILQVVEELNKTNRDYFLIFAHVEQKSGLWHEMGGGKIQDFTTDRYAEVRNRTLGFQKVRTRNSRTKIQQQLSDWYPAEIEGSDCKSCDQIGKGTHKTFIKIGEPTFESVKFALHDWQQRVSPAPHDEERSPRLQQISFQGGLLDGETFPLSDELTCLIGSRGSGKSSVIECLRYGLNLEAGDSDLKYKNGLVSAMLANGGEISVTGITSDGSAFEIRRPLGYDPVVRLEGEDTRLRPIDILPNLLYFGQKDLGHRHDGFEDDLFSKLVGRRNVDALSLEESRIAAVKQAVSDWRSVLRASEKEHEYAQEEERLRHQLAVYQKKGVEKQLERLTTFDADKRNLADFIGKLQELRYRLTLSPEDWGEVENDWPILKSEVLENLSKGITASKNEFQETQKDHTAVLTRMETLLANLRKGLETIQEKERELQEEFAALQRDIDTPGLNLADFRSLKSRHEQLVKLLNAAGNRKEMADQAFTQVRDTARALHDLWREWHRDEFQELASKGAFLPSTLNLSITYEGNRDEFRSFLKAMFAGTRFRSLSIDKLAENFDNGLQMMQRKKEMDALLEGTADLDKLNTILKERLADFLTYRVPDKRLIKFNEVPIQDLSLGQRATALLQLLMSLEGHPIFLIDQPEDDLDNETIFQHVVAPLLKRKHQSQFIIATHNPNIPVLGDAELVHACRETDKGQYGHSSGSIDSKATRDAIVSIMEGGAQAFEQRQKIYSQWTNSL